MFSNWDVELNLGLGSWESVLPRGVLKVPSDEQVVHFLYLPIIVSLPTHVEVELGYNNLQLLEYQ